MNEATRKEDSETPKSICRMECGKHSTICGKPFGHDLAADGIPATPHSCSVCGDY